MTTQEFIQQLVDMHVSSYNNDTKSVQMTNGIEVSYRVEVAEVHNPQLALQMQLMVKYQGAYVMRWGAETEEDNRMLAGCWLHLKNKGYSADRDKEQELQHIGYRTLMRGLK